MCDGICRYTNGWTIHPMDVPLLHRLNPTCRLVTWGSSGQNGFCLRKRFLEEFPNRSPHLSPSPPAAVCGCCFTTLHNDLLRLSEANGCCMLLLQKKFFRGTVLCTCLPVWGKWLLLLKRFFAGFPQLLSTVVSQSAGVKVA